MLYTTYLSNFKKVAPRDCVGILITRKIPKGGTDFNVLQELSPSEELLNMYKCGYISWSSFRKSFIKQITNNEKAMEKIENLRYLVESGVNIALICYEKDSSECHRSIVAELIGTQWIEL